MSSSTLLSPAPTDRLARAVRAAARRSAARPKLVIALWLALIVACVAGGTLAGTRSLSDAASGSGEAGVAERQLQHAGLLNHFNESIVVRSGSAAQTAATASALRRRIAGTRYVHAVSPATGTLSADAGRTQLIAVTLNGDPDHQADHVTPLQRTVSQVPRGNGVHIGEAGDGSFTAAENSTISSGMQGAEIIAVPITLLILALAFGALAAAVVPLILGLTSVGAAMGALGLVSQIAPEGSTTSSVVILIGLAVGVDYSLFYIRRERAERRAGAGPEAALDAAAGTVGRAVLIAGATVIIGLIGLLFTGNPVFVSMGLGAILVVAIAVLGSLTVLPATLALLGDRIERGRLWKRRQTQRDSLWARSATAVTARPRLAMAVALTALAVLSIPLLGMHTANPGSADLPPHNATVVAGRTIDRAFPGGTDLAELVVSGHDLGRASTVAQLRRIGLNGQRLAGGAGGEVSVRVASGGDTAVVQIPVPSGGSAVEAHNVQTLRGALKPAVAHAIPGASALVGGSDAGDVDFAHRMSVMTPLVIGFVLALAFALLLGSFRSPLLALAVIGLNLASVGAAFGLLTELFQAHWAGELLGLRSFGGIVAWLPLFAFVVLFGLSMDYTVLILERAREARRQGASARDAAAEALGATGSTVTSAALVMVAVFATFASVPLISFKEMGIGLAAAIALDATIVRGLALPAMLTLLGDRGLPAPARQAWDHRAHGVVGELTRV